jgi:hypothetical protein
MMPANQTATLKLELARQLYDQSLERHGKHHEQTRVVLRYIAALENRVLLEDDSAGSCRSGLSDRHTEAGAAAVGVIRYKTNVRLALLGRDEIDLEDAGDRPWGRSRKSDRQSGDAVRVVRRELNLDRGR